MTDEYATKIAAEVEKWPGVAIVRREKTKRHNRLVLRYGEQERFVVYPSTPGDSRRGVLNNINDLRKTLAVMGAERVVQAKSTTPRRTRNKPDRSLPTFANAPTKADPWEALRGIVIAEPVPVAPVSHWRRLVAWVRGLIAIADTRPKDGDAKQAPLASSAVAKPIAPESPQ